MKKYLIALLALALLFASCATSNNSNNQTTVLIKGDNTPQREFASDEIRTSLSERGIREVESNADYVIRFADNDYKLTEQSYRVEVLGKVIEITGADERGAMYGGLEVAEDIALYGIEGVISAECSPRVLERGFSYNIPLDMRTPSYNIPSDSGQKNIENMWDIAFWHRFFDEAARLRYNSINFRNCNPYAQMLIVPGYEDVALDDVWRTNVPLDNNYRGDLTNAIREADWNDYTVVKKMTIEEKIDFWKEVMSYAKDRGIEISIELGHIYTYSEQGKYGITNDMDNPITLDYYQKCAEALLDTYPDLHGILIRTGENMGWDNSEEGQRRERQWIHDAYVPGLNRALEKDPEREFTIVIVPGSDISETLDMYSDYNSKIVFSGVYTSVHMYATSDPHQADSLVSKLPEGYTCELSFRNEDCFDMRWGDPEFIRELVNNMPPENKFAGFRTGSDGYCYAIDYSSTDPDLYGKQLYIEKHWFNYMLIGRLSFDPTLSDERIEDIFAYRYNGMKGTDTLLKATSIAGKIIPTVDGMYFQDNGDYTWFVAGSWSHPSTFGYLDIKRWMKSNNTYPTSSCLSIEDYALAIANGESFDDSLDTPPEVAAELRKLANEVLTLASEIRSTVKPSKKMTIDEKDYWAQLSDDEAMAYLGLYYAEKMEGAVELRLYNETKDETHKEKSVAFLEKANTYFQKYAEIISTNYLPQHLARVGSFDITEIAKSVEKDVEIASTWRPKPMARSYNAPSKSDYFGR